LSNQIVSQVHFTALDDIAKFEKYCKKLEIHKMPFQKVNSIIRYRHTVRRERIIQLGELGLNQAQIARETGYSYSTVKREIYAIREGLV
jgi:DNA-binding NarL/FixJ family response regulator